VEFLGFLEIQAFREIEVVEALKVTVEVKESLAHVVCLAV